MLSKRVLALLAIPLGLATAQAASLDVMAEQLSHLRAEVEQLSTEVEMKKEAQRGQLRAIDAQVAEVDVQVRREELRLQQLQQDIARAEADLQGGDELGAILTPRVQKGLSDLEARVSASLPYRIDERRQAITQLQEDLAAERVAPLEAANRAWALYEDELRLTRDVALDRQVVVLDGEEVLAQVARIGMVALYFRTEDGRMGYARRNTEGWGFAETTDPADHKVLEEMFETLRKGIVVGHFQLPSLQVGGEG